MDGMMNGMCGGGMMGCGLAPEIVLPTIRYMDEFYPQMMSDYGFKSSFNPTFVTRSERKPGWHSKGCYGLDQGPIVLMIENYRSGLVWRLTRSCSHMVAGLRAAGFRGGGGWRAVTIHAPSAINARRRRRRASPSESLGSRRQTVRPISHQPAAVPPAYTA